jgi:hypothetical protein
MKLQIQDHFFGTFFQNVIKGAKIRGKALNKEKRNFRIKLDLQCCIAVSLTGCSALGSLSALDQNLT